MPVDSCTVTKQTDSANHDAVLLFHSLGKAGVHIFSKSQRANITTMPRAKRSGVQVPLRARDFSLLQQHPDQTGAHLVYYLKGTGYLFQSVRWY